MGQMDDRLLLGLDVGSSRLKAILLDRRGRTAGMTAVPTPFVRTAAGSEMQVAAFRAAVVDVLSQLGEARRRVVGVGITSMGESGTLLGDDGTPRTPVPAWFDARGEDIANELRAAFGSEIPDRTGRPARAATTIAKLGWYAAQGVNLEGYWLGVAGLIAWWLTGAQAQEPSLAATSGAYDIFAKRYEPRISAAAGAEAVRWPPLVTAGEAVGTITRDAADAFGLPAAVPVTIAGHDHLVGAVGAGATGGCIVDSMGSGEAVLAPGLSLDTARRARGVLAAYPQWDVTVTPWPGGDALAIILEHPRPGIALAHLQRTLGVGRDELEHAARSVGAVTPLARDVLDTLEQGHGAVPDGASAAVWAAALEGYAVQAQAADAALREATGATGPTLVFGGGVRSPRSMSAKRRIATSELVPVAEPEAVARGAAIFAGVAAGTWQLTTGPLPRPEGTAERQWRRRGTGWHMAGGEADEDEPVPVQARAKLADIARHADVSIKTVSRVLNGEPYVSEATRERVMAAIDELHYVRDAMAQGLRLQKSGLIGLVIPDIRNPFYSQMTHQLETRLGHAGPRLIIGNSSESVEHEEAYIQAFRAQRVDGLIILPSGSSLLGVVSREIPTVVVDRLPESVDSPIDVVLADNFDAALALTRHLTDEHGLRRTALICGDTGVSSVRERRRGYEQAVGAAGCVSAVSAGHVTPDNAREAAKRVITNLGPPVGVVATNNLMFRGILQAVSELGLKVPRDVSIATFDRVDDLAATGVVPTQAVIPLDAYARAALQLLEERKGARDLAARRVVVRCSIEFGSTCGCIDPQTTSIVAT